MRTLLIALLATVLVSTVFSQVISRRETLTVGIDLTLGMSEDAAVKKLTESGYKLSKHDPPDALNQKGFTSMWFVEERGDGKVTPFVGTVFFSSGRLTSASKDLLSNKGSQVEFGRQLYFAMRDLEVEGNSHCTIETESAEEPEFAQKTANLRCGKKTIVIDLQKFQNNSETVQLNEELSSRQIQN